MRPTERTFFAQRVAVSTVLSKLTLLSGFPLDSRIIAFFDFRRIAKAGFLAI